MLLSAVFVQYLVLFLVWFTVFPTFPDFHVSPPQRKTRSVVELLRVMSSNMGLNSVIFTITQRCPALVDASSCTVYLIDGKRKELWSIATESGKEFRIPVGAGLAGHVATTGEVVNIPGPSILSCFDTLCFAVTPFSRALFHACVCVL